MCYGVYLLACMCHFQGGNFHLKVGGGGGVGAGHLTCTEGSCGASTVLTFNM